jgi:hypothetical protein
VGGLNKLPVRAAAVTATGCRLVGLRRASSGEATTATGTASSWSPAPAAGKDSEEIGRRLTSVPGGGRCASFSCEPAALQGDSLDLLSGEATRRAFLL